MNDSKSLKFEKWIFDSFHLKAEGLGLYRVFAALFLILYGLPQTKIYAFLGSLPQEFFHPPPGPMMFFESFPSESVLLLLHYLLVLSLILLLFGFSTKLMSLAAGLLLLILKGFIYSLGKVNHDILLAVVPLVMEFSGWGKAYSIDAIHKVRQRAFSQNWTLTLLALIIGFMFFTAGFPKILGGWLDWNTQAVQGHFFKQFFVYHRQDLLAPIGFYLPDFAWELFDYTTVLLEVGFLFAILQPKSTRIFICFAVLFHFCTMLLLNISFLPNFLAYAAFLNWNWINRKLREIGESFSLPPTEKKLLSPLIIAAVMFFIPVIAPFLENAIPLKSDLTITEVIIVGGSTPIAIYYLIKQLTLRLKKIRGVEIFRHREYQ